MILLQRQIPMKWNSTGFNPHIHSQIIFERGAKNTHLEMVLAKPDVNKNEIETLPYIRHKNKLEMD